MRDRAPRRWSRGSALKSVIAAFSLPASFVLVERGITCISCLYDCLQSGRNGNCHWHASQTRSIKTAASRLRGKQTGCE
jgi:hypothetical protein